MHFDQIYENLEVWPPGITVQLNPNRPPHAHLVTAAYAPTPTNLNIDPTLGPDKALDRDLNHLQSQQLPFSDQAEVEDQIF